MEPREQKLKSYLDHLYATYGLESLYPDPLFCVRRFRRPEDQEVVGLLAACLAYGIVERILYSIEQVLSILGPRPAGFVRHFNPRRDAKKFDGFVHRFNRGKDIACLVYFMQQAMETSGSLGKFFLEGYHDEPHLGPALSKFVQRILALDASPLYGSRRLPEDAGVRFFFPDPEEGSACKRLNLFLRWMVRRDAIDLGLWREIPPSKLIMPVDAHIWKISRRLGLTTRKTVNWRMALEITEHLKRFDPDDPVRYDFALHRVGLLDRWYRKPENAAVRSDTLATVLPKTEQHTPLTMA